VRSRLRRAREKLKEAILSASADERLRESTIKDLARWAGRLSERLRGDPP
jgi:hypothetical protein